MSVSFPPCPTCEGRGSAPFPTRQICSSCGGSGVEITDETVKVVKLASMAEAQTIDYRGEKVSLTERNNRLARAGLVALVAYLKENQ